MHILFIGAASPIERGLIIGACKENALEHQEILQPSITMPLVEGPMGIMREAPKEDLQMRVAKEIKLLDDLDSHKVAGIVLRGFGVHIALTRFSLTRELRMKHLSIPILVIEGPSTMTEVIRHYGGEDHVIRFEGVKLAPPHVHIITESPKIAEHIRAFVNLCARRLSAS